MCVCVCEGGGGGGGGREGVVKLSLSTMLFLSKIPATVDSMHVSVIVMQYCRSGRELVYYNARVHSHVWFVYLTQL